MTAWGGREPRRWQAEALEAVRLAWRAGNASPLVHACTGSGKSVLIAELASSGRGRCLITTPSQLLVDQLAETVRARLPGEVGRCFQHAWEPEKRVVVTCNASLDELLVAHPEWGCWIADEAHRIEGDVLRATSAQIARKAAVGLTATPYRADKRGLATWSDLVYSYTSGQAVRDGVLVPWRAVRWDGSGEPDTDRVVEGWVGEASGPGIVSAINIEDAESFAARLTKAGIPAEPIHQKLNRGERELRIRRLRSGRIRCLVHVQLLCEGIDLPWLEWLALRRPVGSPVRLVQEVGRVLRASPGKREAVLYDPHDLLGDLGLVHAAALEDAQRSETEAGAAELAWTIPELEGLGDVSRLPAPKAVQAVEGWVTDVLGQMRLHELAPPPSEYEGGAWRRRRATPKQRGTLAKMAWAARYLPDERHRRAVRWVVEREEVRAGTASDLIDVLKALADATADARNGGPRWECPFAVPGVELRAEGVAA